ncbi:MAG: 16S rRNA (cytosine(967)-C(5))-methyltransferase RsmB [Eubacteriales bacterium]
MNYKYRKYSIDILYKVNNKKAYSNILIEEYMNRMSNTKDRNLLNLTVNGVLENKIYLDWIIKKLSKTKFSKISKKILENLRIGIYQIEFLDNINPKVVVFESVEEAKKEKNKHLYKFVNGILRSYLRRRDELNNNIEKLEKEKYLSIKYSYPLPFINKLKKEFDDEKVKNILISLNQRPSFTVRTNSTLINREELMKKLDENGVKSKRTEFSKFGIKILNSDFLSIKSLYDQGLFSVQGESSMISSEILNPKLNSKVLDLCSAPGGKGLHLAELMNNTGIVDCRDIYLNKVNTIENQIKRLKIKNVITKVEDASKINENNLNYYDYCIVDVPCSNSGTIRKKPEIKYKTDFDNLKGLRDKQLKILENAGKYLKSEGTMIYSTCSIFKEENIDIINKFLQLNKNFTLEAIDKRYCEIDDNYKKGYLNILPHINNLDGFFIAKIKKTKI